MDSETLDSPMDSAVAQGGGDQRMAVHSQPRVVIIGGGFGGLYAARSLKRVPVQVTVLDKRNFHLFQPLLYQVATGGLSPANISAPLRGLLRRQRNTRVLLAEVVDFDAANRRVILSEGSVPYDTLIVAAGSRHSYFGHPQWEEHAPGLKTIEDATEIRRRILLAFEGAELQTDPARVREWLTFVVVGGGPTGVEMAGALAEIARHTLKHDFRAIDPTDAHIFLLEARNQILPAFSPALAAKATASLERLGVHVRTNVMVTDITKDSVTIRGGEGTDRIVTRTIVWAAGVETSRLAQMLSHATGSELDRQGRIFVQPDLSLPQHPEILVIGDMAHCRQPSGDPLPGLAPVAMQQGRYAAKLIARRLRGATLPPFQYRDRGTMATIGRSAAVANLGGLELSGFVAWLIWLFVHLINLVQHQNRLLVLIHWAWNYVTRNRAARLITGDNPLPLSSGPGRTGTA